MLGWSILILCVLYNAYTFIFAKDVNDQLYAKSIAVSNKHKNRYTL
jgi:hypothetical protein